MKTARVRVTEFELQVLTLMARGVPVKAIGFRLGVCDKAVSSARRRVLKRNRFDNYLQLGLAMERCQTLHVDERNRMEDRREERLDALRSAP
jgi:DNA-binding NarL/FixJ family response regulator